jgi:hypothetical protein
MLDTLALELGVPRAAGLRFGEYRVEGGLEFVAGDDTTPQADPEGDPRGGNNGTVCGVTSGPDVIVGTLTGTANYSSQEQMAIGVSEKTRPYRAAVAVSPFFNASRTSSSL